MNSSYVLASGSLWVLILSLVAVSSCLSVSFIIVWQAPDDQVNQFYMGYIFSAAGYSAAVLLVHLAPYTTSDSYHWIPFLALSSLAMGIVALFGLVAHYVEWWERRGVRWIVKAAVVWAAVVAILSPSGIFSTPAVFDAEALTVSFSLRPWGIVVNVIIRFFAVLTLGVTLYYHKRLPRSMFAAFVVLVVGFLIPIFIPYLRASATDVLILALFSILLVREIVLRNVLNPRLRLYRELAASESRQQAFVNLVSDYAGIILLEIVDQKIVMTIEWVNENASTLFNVSIGEKIVYDEITQGSTLSWEAVAQREMLEQTLLGESHIYELQLNANDGKSRWVRNYLFPSRLNNGTVRVFIASQDITEIKQTQELVNQAHRIESIGLLAGGIAHDFNNLLTGILGQASLVQYKLGQLAHQRPEPVVTAVQNHMEKVVLAAEKAADLTSQLLAYAGEGKFQITQLNLNNFLLQSEPLLKTMINHQVHLQLDLTAELPLIEVDARQLQQVVFNLVINGAEAIAEPAGRVQVHTAVVNLDEETAKSFLNRDGLAHGRYVALTVQDTGSGMSGETICRIFDPFFTTKPHGRGLGLAATVGIIYAHGGGIRVVSQEGEGTTFTVLFPAL